MQNEKLADVETKLHRWHTRLTRASNMVTKLEKQRRRLLLKPVAVAPKPKAEPAKTTPVVDTNAADLGIPPFLDRKDPLIAESMTAARKAAEAEARKRMPLTGRAALDAIRGTRKKAKANA
jgi:hypothetical protein